MTVAEAQDKVSTREFLYWQALYILEPFGSTAGYIQAAQGQAGLYNINRRRGAPSVKISDCMLKFEGFKTKATKSKHLYNKIEAMMTRINRKFEDKPNGK